MLSRARGNAITSSATTRANPTCEEQAMRRKIHNVISRLINLRTARAQGPQAPTLECLEPRVLLSVAAEFDEATGTLTLTGDDANNRIRVSRGDVPGEVSVKATGLNGGDAM